MAKEVKMVSTSEEVEQIENSALLACDFIYETLLPLLEEFENDKIDKFVYLDRSFDMICEYNMKYKRWQPQQLR